MHVHFAGWIGLPELPPGASWSQGDTPDPATTVLVDGTPEEEHLDLPHLEAVIVPWAGIPMELAQRLETRPHIKLYNLHVNAQAVAELTLGLLLAAARGISAGDQGMRQGSWVIPDESFPNVKLHGLTACLLGYGAIAKALEPALHALGVATLSVRRRPEPGQWSLETAEEAISQSHILIVSLPLSDSTEGWLTYDRLMLLREPRLVVNVGRGPLIEEEGLYRFLKEGQGTAGLDVWYSYPGDRRKDGLPAYPAKSPFHELPNLVMSPHRGGWTTSAEPERTQGIADLLLALSSENPPEPVDPRFG